MFNRLFGFTATTLKMLRAETRRRLAAGALLFYVREPEEWARGQVPGACHIPLGQVAGRLAEQPKDRGILLICRSGSRRARAAALMQRASCDSAINVAGGMGAWARQGLPLTRR